MDHTPSQPLYRQLADQYRRAIGNGALRPGDRMPSMRAFMQRHGVSLATATESYRVLEREALIDARPRAGYFVRMPSTAALPAAAEPDLAVRRARRNSSAFIRRFPDRLDLPALSGCAESRRRDRVARSLSHRCLAESRRARIAPAAHAADRRRPRSGRSGVARDHRPARAGGGHQSARTTSS